MRSWPLLLSAAALLTGAGVKAAATGQMDALSAALLAAGLIIIGAWIAVEVHHELHGRREAGPDKSEEDE